VQKKGRPLPPWGGYPFPLMTRRHGPQTPDGKVKILARLRSVEGHLGAVLQMVESDAYCIDVLRQTKAIHAALAKVEGLLLDRHLHHCVATAVRSEDARERERVLGELLDVFDAKKGRGP
jgi:DNA-binding FrmR family transcriptional regulator